MERDGKKFVVIYLEEWQRRMIKDFLGLDCCVWEVELVRGGSTRYGIFPPTNPSVKRMYLTDWQMRELKEESGQICEFLELEAGVNSLYGVPDC